jgi:hypothetical protein
MRAKTIHKFKNINTGEIFECKTLEIVDGKHRVHILLRPDGTEDRWREDFFKQHWVRVEPC